MGIYECNECGKQMCGISFWCEKCKFGYGDGNILCEECANEGGCDECGEGVCVYCVEESKYMFPCCGMTLCGAGKYTDEDNSTCLSKHTMKTLPCGHDGCNFYTGEAEKDKDKCFTCEKTKAAKVDEEATENDVDIIQSIMAKIKSSKIKAALQGVLDDPEGKKRKREDDRVAELESNLKRARNACNACRCGRASYY
ncbi:hypothetical protein CTEN210_02920 [Chaetoceros tenuissimus]|uniref:Uncharacterized protein n=1 Tax=Chaetoceros tenuissimus TaxID=426638 RepID=A0AAD3CKB2_9STRA|nr:hypothetical protein CTEN210_02920 [Chaetoceros tenuissimus]